MQSPQERVVYADLLRIFATFAVIVMHVAASGWSSTPVSSFDWQVYNLYDSLARWAVPVFVMLSGMFLLDPQKDTSTAKIYRKYILRIILAGWPGLWHLFLQHPVARARELRKTGLLRSLERFPCTLLPPGDLVVFPSVPVYRIADDDILGRKPVELAGPGIAVFMGRTE